MSDSNGVGRRDLLTAGVAGIVGAAAGYTYGRRDAEPPEPAGGASDLVRALPQYRWEIRIQGGYAWWFKTSGNKTTVTLMSLARNRCSCADQQHECIEHAMKLIAFNTAEVDASTTYEPTSEHGAKTWLLSGATRFIKGMPGQGITQNARTKWDDLRDPHAPADPGQGDHWKDQVWLPEREKARGNAADNASAAFVLTDGDLEVVQTGNRQARAGRWVFRINGVDRKKALTDALDLTGYSEDLIGIETQTNSGTKQIFLKPAVQGGKMKLAIRHAVNLPPLPIRPGDKLAHFARLYDFVQGKECRDAVIPVFEKRNDTDGEDTPGDLCPPLPLD